jgi:hypothetical protein
LQLAPPLACWRPRRPPRRGCHPVADVDAARVFVRVRRADSGLRGCRCSVRRPATRCWNGFSQRDFWRSASIRGMVRSEADAGTGWRLRKERSHERLRERRRNWVAAVRRR